MWLMDSYMNLLWEWMFALFSRVDFITDIICAFDRRFVCTSDYVS